MLIEADASDFAVLLACSASAPFTPVPDSVFAPPEVLQMLADLAVSIRPNFAPCAWMIVECDEIFGLLTAVRPPVDRESHIGYGIAPSRRGRGIACRAVADIIAWAASDSRVCRVTAETAVGSIASQYVLEQNGFGVSGERQDPEDGDLLLWERAV